MIEGNLEDISLPGLLQLLAAESTKSYRLRISKGGQHGDIFVCDGHVLVATFGILEGVDALTEFLNWADGEFVVEKLPSHFKTTIRSNMNLNLSDPGCFADQCAFLYESNVGLNTEIVPSRTFGTAEWQDALHVQPLEKEDYAILGWITDGRTMRQAMREFQFDLKKTTGVLYRLLITRSVEVVRPTAYAEPPSQADNFVKLANKELAKHSSEPAKKQLTVEFHATDIGGARARPRDTGSGLRALPAASDNDSLTSPEKAESTSKDQNSSPASEVNAKSDADSKPPAKDAAAKDSAAAKPAGKDADVKPSAEAKSNKVEETKAVDGKSVPKEPEPRSAANVPEKATSNGDGQLLKPEVSSKEVSNSSNKDADAKPVSEAKPAQTNVGVDTVETTAVKALDKNVTDAIASESESDDLRDNFKKQLKKATTAEPATAAKTSSEAAVGSSSTTASKLPAAVAATASPPNGSKSAPSQTQDKLPAVDEPALTLKAVLSPDFDDHSPEVKKSEVTDANKVLNVVASAAPPAKAFDERRTDPLPLVSIDIERLLASTFQLTGIGQRALENTSLDELLKQVLLDVERGKTLLLVLTDSNRSESAVLASYRYCLDRGYIEHTDPVMSLTVDLLLGRLELEQYLLQRRRITGDQLRDMLAISHRQGIGLDKLLVAAGYMLPVDMERVRKEKERFCPR